MQRESAREITWAWIHYFIQGPDRKQSRCPYRHGFFGDLIPYIRSKFTGDMARYVQNDGHLGSGGRSTGFFVVLDTTPQTGYASRVTLTIEFEWDRWNAQKNEIKHGVSRLEAESAFFDSEYKLFQDWAHSTGSEPRYVLYGQGLENRVLMIGFTVRRARVRVITARPASRKERRIYEAEQKQGQDQTRHP